MFIVNNKAPSVFYRNNESGRHWLKVRTVGTTSNRDGIGARVYIDASPPQFRDIDGGSSYLCHNEKVAHFGLSQTESVDTVEVVWPSGWIDRVLDVESDQTIAVVEGSSVPLEVDDCAAEAVGARVRVSWAVNRPVGIAEFRVYRREVDTGIEVVAGSGLPAEARAFTDASALNPGARYEYSVTAVEVEALGGGETRSQPATVEIPVTSLRLMQNHPNPFRPVTRIDFLLPDPGPARLTIHDSRGRLVQTIVDTELGQGQHTYSWYGFTRTGGRAASGVYFYRLETTRGVLTRKMLLVR
jgi:hypothetical protein